MNISGKILLCGLLIGSAVPAWAECPTIDDMHSPGVIFFLNSGDTEFHVVNGSGYVDVEIREFNSVDPISQKFTIEQGLYLLRSSVFDAGSIDRVAYNYVETPPVPAPEQQFTLNPTVKDSNGRYPEPTEYIFGQMGTIAFESCTYVSIPVRINYLGDWTGYSETLVYLPELGTSLLLTTSDDQAGTDTFYIRRIVVADE